MLDKILNNLKLKNNQNKMLNKILNKLKLENSIHNYKW